MRVLFFVEHFWPQIGGLEVISAKLVTALAQRGYELVVITDQEHAWMPAQERYGEVMVRRLPIFRAINDRDLEMLAQSRHEMAQILSEMQPDLIHASFSGPGVWLLPKAPDVPQILSFHGAWPMIDFSSTAGVFGRALARADWVTGCSRYTIEYLLRSAPAEVAERASVVLYGLDPPTDGEPPDPPPGPPMLLCSGRLVYEKAMDVAIDALAALSDSHPDVRLVLAGDGPARAELAAQALALGVGDRVQFTGWVSPEDMHELVAQATVVLAPSRLEGFGLTVLDAALMTRPAVVADTGGLPEAVEDGSTGLVVPCDDAAAMAAAVRRLLDDRHLARAMGHAGRRRALTVFSAARHEDDWDALYQRVGQRGRSA
jgi:glycosyltransferase involved in cell wall biosynthesis